MEAEERTIQARAAYEKAREASIRVDSETEQVTKTLQENYGISTIEEIDALYEKELNQKTILTAQRDEMLDECDELLRGSI